LLNISPEAGFSPVLPKGRNYLITPSAAPPHGQRFGSLEVMVCNPSGLRP
jgi:hypothetical protein